MLKSFIYHCSDESETVRLAQSLAQTAKAGDVWALYGTLGMGKSVFSRAFIKQLYPTEEVPSPTFTLVQTYPAADFEIFHFDLYRLKSSEEVWELNMEEAMYGGVCLIEWPEKMGAYLPRDVFRVEIKAEGDTGRQIVITVVSDDKAQRLSSCCRGSDE